MKRVGSLTCEYLATKRVVTVRVFYAAGYIPKGLEITGLLAERSILPAALNS